MAYRTSKTRGRSAVHVEVARATEMPAGMPADAQSDETVQLVNATRAWGPVQAGTTEAAALAKMGAEARWAKERGLRVLEGLGLRGAAPDELADYLDDAREFAVFETERLARTVGGGVCSGGPATMVQSAALELAGSRAAFAAGDSALGSKLAAASRQNLLAAHELTARSAKATPQDPFFEMNRRIAAAQKDKKARQ